MLFQIYGDMAGWQLLGWVMVFVGLVVMNEIARQNKSRQEFFASLFYRQH